jgi:hypothetical protein
LTFAAVGDGDVTIVVVFAHEVRLSVALRVQIVSERLCFFFRGGRSIKYQIPDHQKWEKNQKIHFIKNMLKWSEH